MHWCGPLVALNNLSESKKTCELVLEPFCFYRAELFKGGRRVVAGINHQSAEVVVPAIDWEPLMGRDSPRRSGQRTTAVHAPGYFEKDVVASCLYCIACADGKAVVVHALTSGHAPEQQVKRTNGSRRTTSVQHRVENRKRDQHIQ